MGRRVVKHKRRWCTMSRGVIPLVLAGALLATLCSSDAQQVRIPRVGYLSPLTTAVDATRSEAFRRGLRALGYIEGQNIVIESRFAEGKLDRLPALATELVRLNVDVLIAAGGGLIGRAAKSATDTIPIVMTNVEDPIASGLVVSLAQPGGNVTGLTAMLPELSAKRLEFVRDAVSNLARVAVLWNPAYPEKHTEFKQTQAAASLLGLQIQSMEVKTPNDIDTAFEAVTDGRGVAVITLPDPLTNTYQARIVELAIQRHLPTMFTQRPPVDIGGLMSYGPSYADLFRRAATYVDKILKGAKPADLPVEQPIKFELVINLKTAQALGLTVPPTLLFQADEVLR